MDDYEMLHTPRFFVSSYSGTEARWDQETVEANFPYAATHTSYEAARDEALAKYAEVCQAKPGQIVTLSRVAHMDLEEGDITPTLLRTSDDPSYSYEGFRETFCHAA